MRTGPRSLQAGPDVDPSGVVLLHPFLARVGAAARLRPAPGGR